MSNASSNVPLGADQSAPDDNRQLQVAAICCRKDADAQTQVLLITSRGTGRWIVPKGWQVDGLSRAQSALQEAWEEAGVKGCTISDTPIGTYDYDKWMNEGDDAPIRAEVYMVTVDELADDFPEVSQRERKWFTPAEAANKVQEPQLRELLKQI